MSEKTPENPYESEPQGPDVEDTPIPETPSSTEEAPRATEETPSATEAGQFRTKPMNLDLPFESPVPSEDLTAPGWSSQPPQSPRQPQYPGQSQYQGQMPTQQYPTQSYPTQSYPTQSMQPGPTQSYPTQPQPAQNQYMPQGPYAAQNQYMPEDQYAPQGQYAPPGWPQSHGQFATPYPSNQPPAQPYPPMPGPPAQMPMQNPQPPRRRKKQRPEDVSYAPVTGSLPLSDQDVTEIPADEPITWPRTKIGIVGVANLFLSAVLAVIWAWIPIGLLITGIGGIFALGLGVLALVVWVVFQHGANIFERYRAELIYGDRIPVPKVEKSDRAPGFARFLHHKWLLVKSAAFWRSTAHHFVKMLLGAIIVFGTMAGICSGVLGIFAAINPDGISFFLLGDGTGGLGRVGIAIGALIILASSVAILWFAPYLDRALDRSLLPPARTAALQAEVTQLDRARMAGIDAAAAERLRIERDLHDGAQPRLVALSMTLGMAKSKIDTDPESAKDLVSEAHTESKGIVNELRQLARGIHPAVLTDRGLDAAVSALAGRSPIPIEVDVRLSGRIEAEAEAVAYFVVAECLTNVSKHSGATHAKVLMAPTETGVQIVVTDNGRGGARIDRSGRHTGIAGLVDRVSSARGTLNLTSPAGGPTTVVVEVPCAS